MPDTTCLPPDLQMINEARRDAENALRVLGPKVEDNGGTSKKKDFGSFEKAVQDVAIRVVNGGLAATLNYLVDRKDQHEGYKEVYDALCRWLLEQKRIKDEKLNSNEICAATEDILAYLTVLRMVVKTVVNESGDQERGGQGKVKVELDEFRPKEKECKHPGLLLDKFSSVPANKKDSNAKKDALMCVVATKPDRESYNILRDRWVQVHKAHPSFSAKLVAPMALHLASGSCQENAGCRLHHTLGFAYIPGTGLKGMARAYAETIWAKAQPAHEKAMKDILTVFGNDREDKNPDPKEQQAGTVVFHDAWPETPPSLRLDIVNNHHKGYYAGQNWPTDFEEPNPVFFPVVAPGAVFHFFLAPEGARGTAEDLALAREFLEGALLHLGAGAKTHAGYGRFELTVNKDEAAERVKKQTEAAGRLSFTTTIELVTPAFLAGATQDANDCDLRVPTLRGQLRWWWRTLHAAHVDKDELLQMEGDVWGDTEKGSLITIGLTAGLDKIRPQVCPIKEQKIKPNGKPTLVLSKQFSNHNNLEETRGYTTQGIVYLSYGMDELVNDKRTYQQKRKTRWCIEPGATWGLSLEIKEGKLDDDEKKQNRKVYLERDQVYGQMMSALYLFLRFGALGSRSRKGFGSLDTSTPLSFDGKSFDLELCKVLADQFRSNYPKEMCQSRDKSGSPALEDAIVLAFDSKWVNPWYALDQIGNKYRDFAQARKETGHGKHCKTKMALGLPRNIHGPGDRNYLNKENWQPAEKLIAKNGDRYASPVHISLSKLHDKRLHVEIIAFPAYDLPDFETSKNFLQNFVNYLSDAFKGETVSSKRDNIYAGHESLASSVHETSNNLLSSVKERPKPAPYVKTYLEGSVIKKDNRKAVVRLVSGEEIEAGSAKKYQIGDRVFVREVGGKFNIEEPPKG